MLLLPHHEALKANKAAQRKEMIRRLNDEAKVVDDTAQHSCNLDIQTQLLETHSS
jgi:hypothetical protein